MKTLKNKYGPWVTGDEFFNRDAEIKLLTRKINDGGTNVLVVAPRRVGKTSLIRETFRRLESKQNQYLVFLDIQDCSTPEDVIVAMSIGAAKHTKLMKRVTDVFSVFLDKIASRVESIGAPDLFELKLREGIKGDWQTKGRQLLKSIYQADRRVVICLDELPVMISRLLKKSPDTAEVFLSWLRLVMGEFQQRINFIICGSIGLEPILKRYGLSHTIGHLHPFQIDPWDRETACACLELLAFTLSIQWSDALSNQIVNLLGACVPHHVQMFFGCLHEELYKNDRTDPTVDDIERVYRETMLSTRGHAELADYEERLLRVLDREKVPLALDVLSEAAIYNVLSVKMSFAIADRTGLDDKSSALREVLDVLEHDGYLARSNDNKGWFFVSNLIRDWWKKRFEQSYIRPMLQD